VEGFGLRGLRDTLGMVVMDAYIVWAWVVFGVILLMACTAYMYGNERQSIRGQRVFWPLFLVGFLLAFATPTGYCL